MNYELEIKDKKIVWSLVVVFNFLFLLFNLQLAQAASPISATPVVIDLKAKARDTLNNKITLENKTDSKVEVYAFVNNILSESGRQEFLSFPQADLSSSLANWLRIYRGVLEFAPKERKEIAMEVEVNLQARPGIYHAEITFSPGGSRDEAERRIPEAAKVTVNLEVLEDAKEHLELRKFVPERTVFSGLPVNFIYALENVGNKTVTPGGEIRIYNRRGEEIQATRLNQELKTITPGQIATLQGAWTRGKNFGKYKAVLALEYGANRTLQDTVFFWVIPLKRILITFGGLGALLTFITIWWHARLTKLKI